MDGGMRSAGPSGVFVKNRNSSGCLIVKKKGDGVAGAVGSSSSRSFMDPRKEKKRPSAVMSDSGSSEELLMPSRRRVDPETIRACNGLSPYEKGAVEDSGIPRKRERLEQLRHNEDGLLGMRGYEERERKRGKLDVFDFDEYDGMEGDHMRKRRFDDGPAAIGERRFVGSVPAGRISNEREYESGSSRHVVDQRKQLFHDRTGGLNLGDNVDRCRLKMNRDGGQVPLPMLRGEHYVGRPDEAIRVQGKNGVLKVLVNKKKIGGGTPLEHFDRLKPVERKRALRTADSSKRNIHLHPHLQPEIKRADVPAFKRAKKSKLISKKSISSKESDDDERNSENSDTSSKLGLKNIHARKSVKRRSYEDEPRLKNVQPHKPIKRVTSEDERTPVQEKLPAGRTKEGKVKRGSGTEKQKLRERIRAMLYDAGWTIDYRPRRNRDYLDAVYINPGGTAYWSIIKAYDALQKQLNEDKEEVKPSDNGGSSFAPISDEVLSQLTRNTRKKLEKEMKKKKKAESESDSGKQGYHRHDMDCVDSDSHEEKIKSYLKQGGKPGKGKINDSGGGGTNSRSQNFSHEFNDGREKPSSGSDSHSRHERKYTGHSRCALVVRGSKKGLNSETDKFVPYTGKCTTLSWLIDSGTVQLSQKVLYRRRKKVMLEGWVTRDGIHCGCCSKILTVSKFEIHAGSKLRQPYQHIFLESGVSLLQCQIDAWNRQEGSEKIKFYSVDVHGDDPNDDTCGICGDGGDLICCDGCPSTFHLSCLHIEKLPPGEWHCPNCSCKFCGLASGIVNEDDEKIASTLCTCNLCEKKYHESCVKDMDATPTDSDLSHLAFCGEDCKELFDHLKKYLGAKHELEAGFSWSLVHRSDEDSDAACRGIFQRVESNSKLAVALTVMNECFLPIVDRRSGVNLIQNVLYNSGSNFSRLNYSGFYAAVLEKGDEIISVASIRFHGTKLAEMPFIGTRHVYRRQGMCRRLLSALESALYSLKVERLIIPAIAELMHTWTANFGFAPLEESVKKETRSMNMLVFPGVDMLQKRINPQVKLEGTATTSGRKQIGQGENDLVGCDVANRSDMDSPSGGDPYGRDDDSSQPTNEINDGSAGSDSGSQNEDVQNNDASIVSCSLNVSHGPGNLVSADGTLNSESDVMPAEYAYRKSISPLATGCGTVQKENLVADSPAQENPCLSPQLQGASLSDTLVNSNNSLDDHQAPALAKETACHGPKLMQADSGCKSESPSALKDDSQNTENNRNRVSEVSVSSGSSNSGDDESSLGIAEAPPSSRDLSSANIMKDVNDEPNVSDGGARGADETLTHVTADMNADASEEGNKLHVHCEAASSETHSEENATDNSACDSGNEAL